jgi:hypothetical protein
VRRLQQRRVAAKEPAGAGRARARSVASDTGQ